MESENDPLEKDKQLKVKVPLRHHLRLHSVKVLTGQNISDTVTEALVDHLEGLEDVPDLDLGED